jgi:16S rRNA (guanine966-N2)-methyltransferase
MKDRVREAVFNLLGPRVSGGHAIDLFAGTGALGLEALSRTASRATFIERHRASCKVLRENVARLGAQDRSAIVEADTFRWVRHPSPLAAAENQLVPWLVFCSPPYDFYVERAGEMVKLLTFLAEIAPRESVFVVESDRRFDWGLLDGPDAWQLRDYPPARIGVRRL